MGSEIPKGHRREVNKRPELFHNKLQWEKFRKSQVLKKPVKQLQGALLFEGPRTCCLYLVHVHIHIAQLLFHSDL